ncbi:Glutathione S-transferase hmp2 [Lachnellula cervina]|uniref:glutathione transferase n=1 Tax=Lachnellula cervina TaxID=1316786 RepID=A0A7D8UV52_9HELO|nr:Glutathione S-transferase hmp2 [Lachnellula cervina]
MTLKVYGIREATCTSRVLTVLAEKGVTDYEFITMGAADMKSPEHLARQPFGKIPAIDDDGFVLSESRAICKYLAKKYANQGTKLMPDDDDLKGYGRFEEACSIEAFYFNHPAESISSERLFKGAHGKGPADEVLVAQYKSKLDDVLKTYDVILAKRAYLAGDQVSLADLFHLPYGKLAKELGFPDIFDPYPNVKRWFESLEARESWKTIPSIMELFARMRQEKEGAAK